MLSDVSPASAGFLDLDFRFISISKSKSRMLSDVSSASAGAPFYPNICQWAPNKHLSVVAKQYISYLFSESRINFSWTGMEIRVVKDSTETN